MKRNKILVRVVCILLVVLTFGMCTIGSVASASTIYYSDLFFGYSPKYLMRDASLSEFSSDTSGVMNTVLNDYLDSPDSIWMTIKSALGAATDLKTFIEVVSISI